MFKDKTAKRHLIVLGVFLFLVIACVIGGGILTSHEAALTIRFHYSGFKTIKIISRVVSFLCGCGVGSSVYLLGKDHRRLKSEQQTLIISEQKISEQLAHESKQIMLQTPESIYAYVEQIREDNFDNAEIRNLSTTIIEQFNTMNEYQDKLTKLLRTNGVLALGDAEGLLQDIEDALCMGSTKRLINCYIVDGRNGFLEHAESTISDNYRLLEQAEGVLKDILELMNGNKTLDEVTTHIAAFRKTIQNFIKEENEDGTQFEKDFGNLTLPRDGD